MHTSATILNMQQFYSVYYMHTSRSEVDQKLDEARCGCTVGSYKYTKLSTQGRVTCILVPKQSSK